MNVTRKNFYDIFPELEKAVSEASFIAIDGEFTGLNNCGRELEIWPFDTPQQYYEKQHQRALDFLMLQFGACLFNFDKEERRYTYQAFNFYLFPATGVRGCPNLIFQCQSSSIAFLAKNGFDFNKAFREGIPFMTQNTEDRLRELMQERHSKMNSNGPSREISDIPIPEEKKAHLESNLALIESFVKDDSEIKNELVLKNCPPLMRRLLYQQVPKKFGDSLYMETQDDFTLLVLKNSQETRKKKQEERKMREVKELEDAVGFSRFVKLLSASGKLIVGHNCLLDLCHIVNSFCYPLPADYNEFKDLMHHVFHRIVDTKHMAESTVFQEVIPSTNLGDMLKILHDPPFEMPSVRGETDRCYDINTDKSHEAGYDAFMTGLCFLSMCQFLCKKQGRNFDSMEAMSDILKNFENRIYLSRIQDIPFIQLGGPDRAPPRNHVFHLTFPREWRHHEVTELFKPFGPVFVSFLDDQSAFVALHRRNQANVVLRTMTENNTYKITPFSVFQKQLLQKKSSLQSQLVNTLNSSYADLPRKRKVLDSLDSPPSPALSKKHCSNQQASDSSIQIPHSVQEDVGHNASGMGSSSAKNEEKANDTRKEFPEDDEW